MGIEIEILRHLWHVLRHEGGRHIKTHMRHTAEIFCAEIPSRTDR